MADVDRSWLTWAAAQLDGEVEVVRGMREGGAPWLLRVLRPDAVQDVVLCVTDSGGARAEAGAMPLAWWASVPVPRVLGYTDGGQPALLLLEAVPGRSAIPICRPVRRLRALGAAAASLHAVDVPDGVGLPYRDRPIAGVDVPALRRHSPTRPLLQRAERAVSGYEPVLRAGFVHGDLWQGNSLWRGDDLLAVIDWDCAGVGPAGVDLGSLRCDAAVCFGLDAAEDVLDGWQDTAGRAANDVPYWDAVAALSTPPDMGWFVAAIADQGRPDLTRSVLLDRRDAFLEQALDALQSDSRT